MLAEVLSKIRVNRRKGGGARGLDSRKIDMVNKCLATRPYSSELTTHNSGGRHYTRKIADIACQ